ncbi:MAG: S8 family serine peptidase [Bacteroidota bacterium]
MQQKAIFLSLWLTLGFSFLLGQQRWNASVVPPVLQNHFESQADAPQGVWLHLSDQVDARSLDQGFYEQAFGQAERVNTLLPLLQQKAQSTQADLLQYLQSLEGVHAVKSLWISNTVFCYATLEAIQALSFRPELAIILPDPEQETDAVVESHFVPATANGHEAPHDTIRAPFMWNLGFTGYGTNILIIDSGVDANHPSLASNYRGQFVPNSQAWYDSRDNSSFPFDCGQHGTHVAGIAVGLDPATNDTTGVAPRANWMGSPSIRGGSCSAGQFPLESLQWALNPDNDASTVDDMPDVINNSYGTPFDDVTVAFCTGPYRQALNVLEAAGIAVVFAAGNDGTQGASTVSGQAHINTDLVNSFSVASVNALNFRSGFSSKGPSICGGDGSIKKKPEVAAPGAGIRAALAGGSGYFSQSGTSMSAPATAGALLLLKEAFPDLTGTQLKLALYFSARDLGPNGEDDSFGMGLIDVSAAYQYLINEGHIPSVPNDDLNVSVIDILNLEAEMCGTSIAPVLQLKNNGSQAFTQLKIDYRYNDSLTGQYTWNGNGVVGSNIIVPLPNEIIPTGGYTLEIEVVEVNGQPDYRFVDNQDYFTFAIVADSISAVLSEPICQGESGLLSVLTSGTGSVIWHDDSIAGTELATGSALVMPALQNDTTVYASIEYRRETGKKTYIGDDGFFDVDTDDGLIFDAMTPFKLKSVMVLSQADGQRLIELRDAGGAVIASKAIAINLGPRVIELDFDVPAEQNLQLAISGSSNLFVSSSMVYFPYGIPQVVSIERSLAGGNTQYPYFYDWQIEYPGTCARIPVSATVAQGTAQPAFSANITQLTLPDTASVSFTDQSVGATAWLWNFGDGDTSTLQNPTHVYTYTGSFPVALSVLGSDGCRVATAQTLTVGGINTDIEELAPSKMLLYPNPTSDQLVLVLPEGIWKGSELLLYDLNGRLIMRRSVPAGERQIELSLAEQANGLYLVRLQSEGQYWQEKVWKQ